MATSSKSYSLVLGGGGARGFFHMGVIKAIQELNLKIDQIAGTSIGAVIGTAFAANPRLNFETLAQELDFFKLTQTILLATRDNSGAKIESFLRNYIPAQDFSDLKIPLVFNATDINHRQEVVFDQGPIFPGLVASVSIPGAFPPLIVNEHYLVDGGVVNNVPITLLKSASRFIVSDITGPIKKIDHKTFPIDILYSSVALMQQTAALQNISKLKDQVVYLHLDDDSTFILDFRKKNYQTLIDLGYHSLMSQKDSL